MKLIIVLLIALIVAKFVTSKRQKDLTRRSNYKEERENIAEPEEELPAQEPKKKIYVQVETKKRVNEDPLQRIHLEVEKRKNQFLKELIAIPQVSITVGPAAKKQYLKDMPEYGYSNITAKTKLDKIFPLVVIDVETTGLTPSYNEIVEISAIKFDVGMIPVSSFTTLCRPKNPIPSAATAINHITDEMVADSPNFRQVAADLSKFIAGCNLVGHNLDFDVRFIYVHGVQIPFEKRMYDTLEIAQKTIKRSEIGNHKLETLCSWYGIHRDNAHRSLSDCYATAKVFARLIFDKTSRDLENEIE